MKILTQLFLALIFFFATWYLLSLVDWMKAFNIQQHKQSTEEKLGRLIWESIRQNEHEVRSKATRNSLHKLLHHLCEANDIDTAKIHLHVIEKDEVNAFALPGNHIVMYSGLIRDSENEAEVLGVLGHEIAHVQKNHVMKKLIREVGLSALVGMTTGRSGGKIATQLVKTLSSTAYDRALESEADLASVDYMIKAEVDPEGLANFLFRMASEADLPDVAYWMATHPESKERAENIIDYMRDKKIVKKNILTKEEWDGMEEEMKTDSNDAKKNTMTEEEQDSLYQE